MTTAWVPDTPARKQLLDALPPILPKAWQLIADERPRDESTQVQLTLSQRTISRLTIAGTGVHDVEIVATITMPGSDLERAEDRLDDDLEAFLWALDELGVLWDAATKGRFGDTGTQRLGYQLTIHVYTARQVPDPEIHDLDEFLDEQTESSEQ